MRNFRRVLSLCLVCCLLANIFPVSAINLPDAMDLLDENEELVLSSEAVSYAPADIASGTCGDNLTWTLTTDGTLTIVGTGAMNDYSYYTSPWYDHCEAITSVVIEPGVTSVGTFAFYNCSELMNAEIPDSVLSIGNYAFSVCTSLSNIYIPEGVTSIGAQAFVSCSGLESISLPDSITFIDALAFGACTSLSSIQIPNGMTRLSYTLFDGCTALVSVTIPASITVIGEAAFRGCEKLKDIHYLGSDTQWESLSIQGDNDFLLSADMHYSRIDAAGIVLDRSALTLAPEETATLTATVYPENATDKSVTWTSSDESIATVANGVVTAVAEGETVITAATANNVYTVSCDVTIISSVVDDGNVVASGTCGSNVTWELRDTNILTIRGTGAMTDYTSVSFAPWYAKRDSIVTVVIEPGVTRIGGFAFYECANLESVVIPDSMTAIGNCAFEDCSALTTINLPDRMDTMGSSVFNGCGKLTNINIPDGVTDIGGYMFMDCISLESAKIPDSVTGIGGYAFYNCGKLTAVDIPNDVFRIGGYAFFDCSSLTEIEIPDGVQNIDQSTFAGCTSLTNIRIPYSVVAIGDQAFINCGLESIEIPDSIEVIGSNAFSGCANLESIEIPAGVLKLSFGVFMNCSKLASIHIPISVVQVDKNAFLGCMGLTDVYYEGTQAEWSEIAIGENNSELISASIHCESVGTIRYTPLLKKTGDFSWSTEIEGGDPKDWTFSYNYDESWFLNGSDIYQHDLTKMSIRLAMAAFGTHDGASANSERNIKSLLMDLGFQKPAYHYPEPRYDVFGDDDSIGYAIAAKNLVKNGEDFTIIVVTLRGGGYGVEWGPNFKLGLGSTHRGFAVARDQVLQGIQNYIDKYADQFSSNCKVWITGYSRGAATTNLVAKELIDGYLNGVDLDAEDIYAFCFECPQNTRASDVSSGKYQNIINIVNPVDFVTKVAMTRWGYSRYGTTLFLPYAEGTDRYLALANPMYLYLYEVGTKNGFSNMRERVGADQQQTSILDCFMDHLAAAFDCPLAYVGTGNQVTLIDLAAKTLGGKGVDWLVFLEGLLNLNELIREYFILHPYNTGQWTALLIKNEFQSGHYAELCMAWLDQLDGDIESFANKTYRRVFVNCPVNVAVYNSNGKLVAQILDDVIQEIDGGLVAYIDDNGQKVIALPNDEEYTIDMLATDHGTVTYSVTEYNIDNGNTEKVVGYYEIEVEQDDELHGIVENLSETSDAEYSLFLGEEELSATISQTGDEIREYTIVVNASGNGTSIGGGTYINGEFARVTATADEGYAFTGWYVNDVLVSTDEDYRFLVESDVTITGVFTEIMTSATGVTLNKNSVTLTEFGATETLIATVAPAEATNKTVIWTSGDPAVATVSNTGVVTAVANGTATITATTMDGGFTASCNITVDISTEPDIPDIPDFPFTPSYTVSVSDAIIHGKVYLSTTNCIAGSVVTIKTVPDEGYELDTLIVKDQNGNDVEVIAQGNDKYVFKMPAGEVTIQATFKSIAVQWVNPFADVKETAWYYDAVRFVVQNGIMNGTGDQKFGPESTTTRAMVWTMLARLSGEDTNGGTTWYEKGRIWAMENGISDGTNADGDITREQLVVMLWRLSGSPKPVDSSLAALSNYTDGEDISSYAQQAMAWAISKGIINGMGDGTLAPSGNATRAQVAQILMNFMR